MNKKQLIRRSGKVITKEKSLPRLLADAQKKFNSWIRNRDKDFPCICCGSFNTSDAGHYFSQGQHSFLRFNEMNVNLCCRKCNHFLSGNLINYRQGLIRRYGEVNVDKLELAAKLNRVRKWSKFELEHIIKMYS